MRRASCGSATPTSGRRAGTRSGPSWAQAEYASAWIPVAGVGDQPGGGDAVHGAILVLLRSVAADPDRPENRARSRADQHAASYWDHAASGELGQRGEELRRPRGAAR